MVSRLTLSFIGINQPLLMKPFRLGILTNRAIPLFLHSPINLIKRVSVLADSFSFVYCTNRLRVLHSVLQRCHLAQMLRINAVSILANMVNNHAISDVSKVYIISNSVRSPLFLPKVKSSVAILIAVTSPKNAVALLRGKISKPFRFFYCKCIHVGNYTPCSSM